ncbi:DUF2798 domain-containing protein [Vogesella sp. GCM10023246]|uniref:DUF2798 domain-containing protein n=1 Tax=Vogesella oryzagri TaxID=3160864 RepID=A0ABV1M7I8_9NEIS
MTEGVPTNVPTSLNDEHSAQSEGFQEQLPHAEEQLGKPMLELEPFTSGLLDLSRQQRNLLLLRPLFFLELNKQRIGSDTNGDQGLFEGIDTHYLALSVLDFMMEATTIQMGCLFEEALDHLKKVAHSMKPALSEKNATRVADVVLDALWNRGREFNSDYFDAPTRSTKFIRFRLIEGEPSGIEDRYHYRPTPEGYLVYLGMLDLSVEDSQELMAKMLDLLVQRGRFEAALEVAKRARKLSIEYRQLIRDRLSRAYRAPGSINWSREMSGKLNDARQHVQARQAEDQRMEESVAWSAYGELMNSSQSVFGFRKLPAQHASIVMPFFLSILMTCIVSLISTLRGVGWHAGVPHIWLGAWGISWLIAFPVLLLVLPLVRRLTLLVVRTA